MSYFAFREKTAHQIIIFAPTPLTSSTPKLLEVKVADDMGARNDW